MVQFFPFLCCDLSVFAFSDPVQSQIHDPDPFQLLYLISQIPAHSADLPVQSLGQNDTEALLSKLLHLTGLRHRIQKHLSLFHLTDAHAFSQLFQKGIRHRLVYRDQIFLLMMIGGPHHPVDQTSIVGHQDEPL